MRRDSGSSVGSLDMLLDTMCNTFGGVCFIALMVALMSAALPSNTEPEDDKAVTEQMVVDKETARLERMRDEIKAAIDIQRSFVATNIADGKLAKSAVQMAAGISSNATVLARMKAEKHELEDRLAKLTTDVSYSRREAMRLARLLKEMEEQLGTPANMKSRAVRTPVERELAGYRSIDLWLRGGRIYCLDNDSHVEREETESGRGKTWKYRTRPHSGYAAGEGFFNSSEYRQLADSVNGKMFVRIFSDAESFQLLCDLRDDLIRRRKLYNWYPTEDQTLDFVEGYDGKVQ